MARLIKTIWSKGLLSASRGNRCHAFTHSLTHITHYYFSPSSSCPRSLDIHLHLLTPSHTSICPLLIVIIPPSSQSLTCLCLHTHARLHLISTTLNFHLHYHHSIRCLKHFQLLCSLFVDTARRFVQSLLHLQPPNVARRAFLILILPTIIEFHHLLSIQHCTTSSLPSHLNIRLHPKSTANFSTPSSVAQTSRPVCHSLNISINTFYIPCRTILVSRIGPIILAFITRSLLIASTTVWI